MARFDVSGLEELMDGFEKLANIPEETIGQMLKAQAKVVIAHQKRKLASLPMKNRTGQLEDSIGEGELKRDRDGLLCLHVFPQGIRRGKKTRNAEVGYIEEYGAPQRGIAPTQWMRLANEEAEEETTKAAQEVLEAWQDETGI